MLAPNNQVRAQKSEVRNKKKFILISALCLLTSDLAPRLAQAASLPTSLGWYPIPGTQMINVCPPSYNCAEVIIPWSGGIADTSRNRLIVWGGGHTDYDGNEVYALDLNALAIERLDNPSPPANACVETLSDGRPPSRHTYDALAYIAHADKMMAGIGSIAEPAGCASQATWTLDMTSVVPSCASTCNSIWTNMNPSGTEPANGGVAAEDYDPNTKNVFIFTESYGQFASYNYDTNTYKILSTYQYINDYVTAVIDPTRKLFFMFGQGQAFKIDISGNDPQYTLQTLNASGCSFDSPSAPGVAYDPVQDRIVGWSGGGTVYLYNPDKDSCTSVTYATNAPPAQQSLGTYGRFRYFPALNVFALVNDASQNAYTLRLTTGTGTPPPPPPPPTTSPCDVNGDGQVNVADVQKEVLMALQLAPCTNPSTQCTIIQVEDVVNAVLGGTCVSP